MRLVISFALILGGSLAIFAVLAGLTPGRDREHPKIEISVFRFRAPLHEAPEDRFVELARYRFRDADRANPNFAFVRERRDLRAARFELTGVSRSWASPTDSPYLKSTFAPYDRL